MKINQGLTKEQKEKKDREAKKKIDELLAFRRSRHYGTVMRLFEKQFEKDILTGNYGKLTNLEQIGMLAAIQAEAKQRFNIAKRLIEEL